MKKHIFISVLSVIPISLFFGVMAVSCKTNQPSSTYLNNQSIDVSFKTNPVLVLTNENEYELVINITNANNKTLVASLTKKGSDQILKTSNNAIAKDNQVRFVFSNLDLATIYQLRNISIIENNGEHTSIKLIPAILNQPLAVNWNLDLITLKQPIPSNAPVAKEFYNSYQQLSDQEKRFNWVVAQINANSSTNPDAELAKIKKEHKMFELVFNTISLRFVQTYSSYNQEQLLSALQEISSLFVNSQINNNSKLLMNIKAINNLFLEGLIAAELKIQQSKGKEN